MTSRTRNTRQVMGTRESSESTSPDSFEDLKAKHRPTAPSAVGLLREPREAPLATAAFLTIVLALGYQAVTVVQSHGLGAGLLVGVASVAAYKVATYGWRLENEFIARELAREELTGPADTDSEQPR